MRIKYLFIFIVVALIFMAYNYVGGGNMPMANDISLILSLDKEEYKVGDTIHAECSIRNNSSEALHVFPRGGIYAVDWLHLFELSNRKEVSSKALVVLNVSFPNRKEDFIPLKKGEIFTQNFEGVIKQGKVSYVAPNVKWQEDYVGLYIDFKDSILLLEKSGKYILQAYFEATEEEAKIGKNNFNLPNVWTGKIWSNELEITIK